MVTVETTQPETIEGYAVRLFEKWRIDQKSKDNGVLLLIASDYRKVRIEIGYVIEEILPDATCKMIIEERIIPYFKRGEYSQRILYRASVIVTGMAKEYDVKIGGNRAVMPPKDKSNSISFMLALLSAILLVITQMFGVSGEGDTPVAFVGLVVALVEVEALAVDLVEVYLEEESPQEAGKC